MLEGDVVGNGYLGEEGERKMKRECLLGGSWDSFQDIGVEGPAAEKRLRHKRHTSTAAGKTARLDGPL